MQGESIYGNRGKSIAMNVVGNQLDVCVSVQVRLPCFKYYEHA